MPKFERIDPLNGTRYIAEYDEERLERCTFISEATRLPSGYDLSFLIREGLAGAEILASRLEKILGPGNP